MKVIEVIPIKSSSQRGKDNNLHPFADTTLVKNIIKVLLYEPEFNEFLVNKNYRTCKSAYTKGFALN